MSIPLAVSPSVKSPGLYLQVDLTAGQSSPGSATRRALLIAGKSSAGTITADTEIKEAVSGPDAVSTFLGPGTPGHLAAKALFAEYGLAQVDLVCPLEATGDAAEQTITFASGPPTVSWTVAAHIAGRPVQIVWTAGETDTEGAAKLVLAINAETDLPVTAADVLGVVTLTAKAAGTWGNDIKVRVTTADGATGTVVAPAGSLAAGTTEMSVTNVLALLTGREYETICLCTSNVDAQDGGASSNPGLVKAHMDSLDSGAEAKLQQMVVGATGTVATVKAGTDAMNHAPTQYIYAQSALSLPAEFCGAEVGARLREESSDLAANRIRQAYRATLYTVDDISADSLTAAEIEDLLNNGVTPVSYDATGNPRPERPVTTYHLDAAANPDDRVLDTSRVTGTYGVSSDIQVALPREFAGAKLSEDLDGVGDDLPPGVVEVRDIKSFVDARVRFFGSLGVVKLADYNAAVDNGEFVVRVNPSDSSQCDIVLPVKIVPPLAKFSVVVQHVGP